MTQAPPTINWKDYERFVAQLSWKSYRRARTVGLLMEFDDIFQEAAMAYVRATRTFKPELGYKFITYLGVAVTTALGNHKKRQDRQLIGRTVSLDTMLDDGTDAHDLLPGTDSSPLDKLVLDAQLEEALKELGPLGAQMSSGWSRHHQRWRRSSRRCVGNFRK